MTENEFRQYTLEELKAMRTEAEKATEQAPSTATSVTVVTFPDAEPTAIQTTDVKPPETPNALHGSNGNGNERPESLRGLSALDILLYFTDENPTKKELYWYSKRCMTRTLMHRTPGLHSWMGM